MAEESLGICVAGATGWAGSALCKGIIQTDDLRLISGVSRSHAGKNLSEIAQLNSSPIPLFSSVEEALSLPCDILVEYTSPEMAKSNVLTALEKGLNVIVGTSGLTTSDYKEIGEAAEKHGKGVLAAGNFAITAVLMQKFSEMAAKYIPDWEIIDYAHKKKKDAPSGTARELASRLRKYSTGKTTDQALSRGEPLEGSRVHSVRLPGYVIGIEAIFGKENERLSIRHDAGTGAEPYVDGTLMAIRKVGTFTGLKRGLDSVMEM